jgi:hypothetical protein
MISPLVIAVPITRWTPFESGGRAVPAIAADSFLSLVLTVEVLFVFRAIIFLLIPLLASPKHVLLPR